MVSILVERAVSVMSHEQATVYYFCSLSRYGHYGYTVSIQPVLQKIVF